MRKRKAPEGSEESDEWESLSWEVKSCLGHLSYHMGRNGIKRAVITNVLESSGFYVELNTLRRWENKVKEGEAIFKEEKESGNEPTFSDFEKRIIVGFVISCNEKPTACGLRHLKAFCIKVLNTSVSWPTISRLMASFALTSQTCATDAKGFKYDQTALRKMLRDWVMQRHIDGTWDDQGTLVCSIDFTFTSHRTRRETGFAPEGRYFFF